MIWIPGFQKKNLSESTISQRASQPTRNIDIYPTISSDALIAANKGLYIGGAISHSCISFIGIYCVYN